MKYLWGSGGLIAAGALIAVSAAMNWRFGFSLGRTEFDGLVYGGASVAADALKMLMPFIIVYYWRKKAIMALGASCLLAAVCVCYSLVSSLGFSSTNRITTIGEKTAAVNAYQDSRFELDRLKKVRGELPKHRPEGAVKFEIERAKLNRRWAVTSSCTDATTPASRRFCQGVSEMRAELAVASRARDLDGQITALRGKINSADGQTTAGAADPQAAFLSKITSVDVEYVGLALIALVTLMVEAGSTFGVWLFCGLMARDVGEVGTPPQQATQTPEGASNDNVVQLPAGSKLASTSGITSLLTPTDKEIFESWFRDNITRSVDARVKATDLCDRFNKDTGRSVKRHVFGRFMHGALDAEYIKNDSVGTVYNVSVSGRLINAA